MKPLSQNFSPDVLALNPHLANIMPGKDRPGKTVRAKTRPVSGPDFKSKLEGRAWHEWVPAQHAAIALYEPLTFHLTGGRYTPDFVLVFKDGETWIIEVKGSWKAHASGRASKRNLRQAAVEYAWLGRWFSLMPDGKHWKLTEMDYDDHP